MKSLIRGLTILLVLLMLLPSVISCKNNKGNTDVESTESDVAEDSETVIEYDDKGYQKDNLGMQDFGGKEIRILGWKDAPFKEFGIEFDEVEGTVLGLQVYNRNMKVEQRLRVKLKFSTVTGYNATYASHYIPEAERCVTEQSVDAFACYSMASSAMLTRGWLEDMMQYEYLDFTAPWWSAGLVERASMYDRLYFASGSIAPSYLGCGTAVFYNKKMANVYLNDALTAKGAENLYDLVDAGKWTIDNFIELSKTVTMSGVTKTADDTYGYVCGVVGIDPWYTAAGLVTLDNAPDGSIQISEDWNSSKTHTLASKLLDFFKTGSAAVQVDLGGEKKTPNFYDAWNNGKSLFVTDFLSNLPRQIQEKAVGSDGIGILPMPMYDEGQGEYLSNIGFGFSMYSIARNSDRREETAAVLECLASEGYRQTEPELYDNILKTRSTDSDGGDKDRRMLEIVRDSLRIDGGRIHNDQLHAMGWAIWRGSIASDLWSGSDSNYMSYFSARSDSLDQSLLILNSIVHNLEDAR